ncbi:hypothetical protein ACE1TH_09220 [Shouchella sp. JSM 1781072]|uniref:hypothetical protein n=1 Tax=Bacillaceae TaxID=186817 RepID=UPI000C06A990|nr:MULTISPECIES: hypothetical protein [Bacillaceae]UTR07705.1 hypothetical protein MM326_06735 [Alkalihalobacillus sp. LMS6]
MKRFIFTCSLTLSFLFISGCSNHVQDDLIQYLNSDEMDALYQTELDIMANFDEVQGGLEDTEAINFLNENIIAPYRDFITDLEAVDPDTTEVTNLHNQYIEGAMIRLDGYEQTAQFIESGEFADMEQANKLLDEASSIVLQYREELGLLAEEHNVEIE